MPEHSSEQGPERSREQGRKVRITCEVNGKPVALEAYPMARLLDVLREQLSLTGTKEGCGEGECGACAVEFDGELVNSCLVPFLQADKARIRTIEGVADSQELDELQKAFLAHNGAQCGICTPGMIMAALDLFRRHPDPSSDQIREGLAGNLCRCTGYTKIIESMIAARRQMDHRA
jgi:carbon-monoxide dehydrogenase small subunit